MKCCRNNFTMFAHKPKRLFQLLMFSLVFVSLAAQASPLVSADYQHGGGTDFSIRIHVGEPPPASLIVFQRMPAGVNIVRTRPPAQKINQSNGEAKWLFRKLKPGTFTISIALDRAVPADQLSGQVRFKPPGSNAMESIPISN